MQPDMHVNTTMNVTEKQTLTYTCLILCERLLDAEAELNCKSVMIGQSLVLF